MNTNSLIGGKLLLQFDSGDIDVDRLCLQQIKVFDDLLNGKHWARNGTFKCSPTIFYQLHMLHVQVGLFSVLRLFALLPSKNQEI